MRHLGCDTTRPGWTRRYSYNEESQLQEGKYSNRLSRTSISSNVFKYWYGGRAGSQGNVTAMPELPDMEWDYKNQLCLTSKQIVRKGKPETTWYVYDINGWRVRKVTERQTSTRVDREPSKNDFGTDRLKQSIYVGEFEIFQKYGESGTVVQPQCRKLSDEIVEETTLSVSDGRRIALVQRRTKQKDGHNLPVSTTRYQLSNKIGSVTLDLDETGHIFTYEEYSPFGATTYKAGNVPKRYQYSGKELDETGLYYYGARYYCAVIGRWTSPDPTGVADGVNIYCYTHCNPVSHTDIDGRIDVKMNTGTRYLTPYPETEKALATEVVLKYLLKTRREGPYRSSDDFTVYVTYRPQFSQFHSLVSACPLFPAFTTFPSHAILRLAEREPSPCL
jgi:RHS repeat-associated protein